MASKRHEEEQEQDEEEDEEDDAEGAGTAGVKDELVPGQLPAPLKPEALEGEDGRLVLSGARATKIGPKKERAIDVVSDILVCLQSVFFSPCTDVTAVRETSPCLCVCVC